MPAQPDQEKREAHAIIPKCEPLLAPPYYLWVGDAEWTFAEVQSFGSLHEPPCLRW